MLSRILDPNTRRRFARFRRLRRAWWSLWIFLIVFLLSLAANFIANDRPLYVKFDGQSYYPLTKHAFSFTVIGKTNWSPDYPDDLFTGSGIQTRPNYKLLEKDGVFEGAESRIVWAPVKFGPDETIKEIEVPEEVTVTFTPVQRVGTVDITKEWKIGRSKGAASFFGVDSERGTRGIVLNEKFALSQAVHQAVESRFENQRGGALTEAVDGIEISLSEFEPRSRPPRSVRVTLREVFEESAQQKLVVAEDGSILQSPTVWNELSADQRESLMRTVAARREAGVPDERIDTESGQFLARFDKRSLQYPLEPLNGHPFGLDTAGRDVLVQVIYATRVSLLFGLILVVVTMFVGTVVGSIQGFFGGMTDLVGQRFTEIWEALSYAFLFIVMLMGAIFGRGFLVLLSVYAIFNWIPISYYMRGEFLRLRKQPFVEAARVMGIGRSKIMFRHILPNAVVPLITYLPFSLVMAIFSLSALDFLGFGLPPDVPSWGGLIAQAQGEFRHAWWLVLYPAIALFSVMLLSVFIGEGLRNAFDPRSESKLE